MNSNVLMKQETRPRAIGSTSPVLTGLSVEQRHPKGSETPPFTWGNLHPSPPNSQPSPVEPSLVRRIHSTQNSEKPFNGALNGKNRALAKECFVPKFQLVDYHRSNFYSLPA